MGQPIAWLSCALVACLTPLRPAVAQQVSDNPVISAVDAFGLTVGLESSGLYSASSIRGFDPQVAGNARVDGLYFDQQAPLSDRVIQSTTIRVGISEIGFAFPAPTGIVDYQLRGTGDDKATATIVAEAGPYHQRSISVDENLPVGPYLDLPVGVSVERPAETALGYTENDVSLGATPVWRPNDVITVRALIDWQNVTNARTAPQFFSGGEYLPPHLDPGFLGQYWALQHDLEESFGVLLDARLSTCWKLAVGAFRSVDEVPSSYADLYLDISRYGLADHVVVGLPDQQTGSDSGEARLTGMRKLRRLTQTVTLTARGRYELASYGGADSVDLGSASISRDAQAPKPEFVYQAETHDRTELWSAGGSYEIQYGRRGQLTIGAQKEFYDSSAVIPGAANAHLTDDPTRTYAAASVVLPARAEAYADYTQGFEDSGTAPSSAANRGAILPTTRSWQAEAGIRYPVTPALNLIGGMFELSKPYFNVDAQNVDRVLGQQRAAGFELSLAGQVLPGLHVNAGTLIGHVQVIGANLAAQGVGTLALGQPRNLAQLNGVYTLPQWAALSVDLGLTHFSSVPATVDDAIDVPSLTLISAGGRWQFMLDSAPATLRIQVQNLLNVDTWNINLSPGLTQLPSRTLVAYLTVDI